MDSREFAEGYEVRQKPMMLPEDPEVASAIEGPRMWASFFDTLVYDYLNENLDTVNFYEQKFEAYFFWMQDRFEATQRTIHKHGLEDERNQRYVNELNFHTMATPSVYLFEQLIRDDAELPDVRLRDIQTELAMSAASIIRQRKQLKTHEDSAEVRSGMVGVYNGQLTEIDTLITLVEIMKSDPTRQLIAMPAPPMFESGKAGAMNADFIVVDKALRQARGLQAKTRITLTSETLVKYEDNRITLIDGVDDLGNSTTGNYRPKTGRTASAMPGLIAMDHLQRLSIKDTPHYTDQQRRNQLMIAKGIARELSRNRKSYIPFAAENVKAKLMHDLYEGPAEPTDKFRHLYRQPENDIVS